MSNLCCDGGGGARAGANKAVRRSCTASGLGDLMLFLGGDLIGDPCAADLGRIRASEDS